MCSALFHTAAFSETSNGMISGRIKADIWVYFPLNDRMESAIGLAVTLFSIEETPKQSPLQYAFLFSSSNSRIREIESRKEIAYNIPFVAIY